MIARRGATALAGAIVLACSSTARSQWAAGDDVELCIAGMGGPDLSARICERAARQNGLSDLTLATLHMRRGRALHAAARAADAIAAFDLALALNPASAAALHGRGVAWRTQGELQRSITDLDHALALSPGFARAYRERGVTQLHAGRMALAARDFTIALDASAHDGEARALRGIARYLNGEYPEAVADLTRAERDALPYDYLGLWIYLAELQVGTDAREALARRAEAVDGAWPAPLYAVYLGHLDPAEALAPPPSDRPALARQRAARDQVFIGLLAAAEERLEEAACAYLAALDPRAPPALEPALARHLLDRTGAETGRACRG